ncbi:uncharacterized protein LOC116260580 isoform X2 [Nymphaea colorata]|uniref:uncharacterized protein LOC116260580 isoform X2 n=1 Tax=Nymphaea colorata TaxID=210225 RepID=UPI00214E6A30|nr:uncharacterized protein LOC116260580 isoform X2 [Nymphaea colorata]
MPTSCAFTCLGRHSAAATSTPFTSCSAHLPKAAPAVILAAFRYTTAATSAAKIATLFYTHAWAVTKLVARRAFKLLPLDDLGEVMDGLLNGSEDLPDINDIFQALFSGNTDVADGTNSCIFDEITIDDLRDCFIGSDNPLQAEFVSLFHAHLEGMAAGETSASSKLLSTDSNNGSTKKEPAS